MPATLALRNSWIARAARLGVVAVAALGLSVCGETPTGPRTGSDRFARLAFQPELRPADRPLFQNANVGIDKVYLVIRAADGTIVFERVVDFPAGRDAVEIVADVPVRGESERFTAQFELRNGTTTIFRGSQEVVARPGRNEPTQTTVALSFVGPGATAVAVSVTPPASTLLPGALATLTANARDAAGATIVNALFSWSSSDPTIVAVSATGSVTAGTRRGTATITASTLSGIRGTADVTVTLPAARVVVESPDNLTGRAGSTLATAFTVRVVASDDVPVPGTVVTFAALASGAQVGSATATTDGTGRASTTMTLGGALGAQSFRATVGVLTPGTLSVQATVGLPDAIAVVTAPPQSETIGRALPQPFTVRVTDRFGNPVPNVAVAWTRVLGNGTLGATTSTTDADGRAQVSYTLGNVPGAESVRATITTASGTATAAFNTTAVALPASRILIVSGDRQSGAVGTPAEQPLVVRVTDALNNNISGATVEWTVGGAATLSASSTQTDADGTARLTPTYSNRPGGVTVRAALGSVSVAFTLTASVGEPAKIAFVAGAGQSVSVSSAVAVAPAVLVTDRFDNPTAGISVVFTAGSGGTVTGSPAVTNSSGVATLGSWTLGGSAGPQSLTATAGSVSTSISATATAPVGPPVLAMATQPSATVQNTVVLAQQPTVQLKNAAGGNLNVAGVVVSVASTVPFNPIRDGLAAVATAAELRGTLTATTNASGVATFTNLSLLGPVGSPTLNFTASGYTAVTSAAINLTAGPAVYLTATSATTLTGIVGAVATPNPQVIARDSALNAVSGVTVTFAPLSAGHGTVVTGAGSVTNASGHASPTSWTYDAAAGTDVITATAAGLVGSPISFTATTTAGAATQLVIVSGNNQSGVTGNPLAAPMVVEARDALNNPVSGVSIAFTTLTGGGTPASASATTSGTGQASFTLTLGAPGGQSVKACLPSCATAQVTFAATSIPVGADAIWNGATSTDWGTAANWSPAAVPTGSNNVFIPSGTPFGPVLGVAQSVGHLTLASGASISLVTNNLSVGGNLLATGATMSSSGGWVYFCGGTHTVAGGSGPIATDCSATVTATGTLSINGQLSTNSSSVFDVGSADVSVSGGVSMLSGSRIKMTTAGGKLTVLGTYTSDPNNDVGDTWMTDGVLELKGDLLATNGCCSQSFRAVGNHITRFSGSGAQTINFALTGNYSASTFGRVEFTGGNTVTLASNMRVHGTVSVTSNTTITGAGKTLFHIGALTTTAGTSLAGLASTQQNGGGTFPLIAGTPPPALDLVGGFTATLPSAAVTFPGNLAIHGNAILDLEGKSLTVSGTFGMHSGSRVKMVNPAAYMRVDGTYTSDPNSDVGDTFMTDGVLELKGDLLATNGCCSQSFRAVGNHLTRFSGSGAQTINFAFTDNDSRSTFGKVEITNSSASGFSTASGMRVLGALTNNGRFTIVSPHTVTVNGAVSLGATSITTNAGAFNKASCTFSIGASITGFTC